MLDTHARKYVQPLFDRLARFFLQIGLTPTAVTWLAFLLGILSAFLLFFQYTLGAIILLWLSGLLDAVDGTMARLSYIS